MLKDDRDEINGVISDEVSESARICLEILGGDSIANWFSIEKNEIIYLQHLHIVKKGII